jgi:hypothetical protein
MSHEGSTHLTIHLNRGYRVAAPLLLGIGVVVLFGSSAMLRGRNGDPAGAIGDVLICFVLVAVLLVARELRMEATETEIGGYFAIRRLGRWVPRNEIARLEVRRLGLSRQWLLLRDDGSVAMGTNELLWNAGDLEKLSEILGVWTGIPS